MYIYQNYPNTHTVKVRSVTTTEYDDNGRVVRTTTVEEYEERPYNTYTWNQPVWYTVAGNGDVTPQGSLE